MLFINHPNSRLFYFAYKFFVSSIHIQDHNCWSSLMIVSIRQPPARFFSRPTRHVNRIEIESIDIGLDQRASEQAMQRAAWRDASQRGTALRCAAHKTWAEREITLDRRRAAEDQLWARRISRCVSPAWPTSYVHLRRVSPHAFHYNCRPFPFLDSRHIELHGRRSNLQSYARARARARLISVTSLRSGGGGMRANSRSPITIPRD